MRHIPLTKGYYTIVDDEDYDALSQHKWCVLILQHRMYAWRTINYRTVYMHKVITGYKQTDHINGNGLDNQKKNLRPANHIQNQGNIKSWSNNTSGFRGVKLEKRTGKWVAVLNTKIKHFHLGTFKTKEEAARAYDKAAKEYFGEFAYLNFPREEEPPSTE